MDYAKTAASVVELVGGKENITRASYCATRLRFNLADTSAVNDEAVKKIEGVSGTITRGGQYQVIIGADVNNVYKEVNKLVGEAQNGETRKKGFQGFIDVIVDCFTPLVPALTASGLLQVVTLILVKCGLDSTGTTYTILNVFGNAFFYFLPVALAVTTAKRLKANPYLAVVIAAVFLNSTFTALGAETGGTAFFGIPVLIPAYGYTSSVIPVMLSVWFMSLVEKLFDKIIPKVVKTVFAPLLTLAISLPAAIIVFGPLGSYIGNYFAMGVEFLNAHLGWFAVVLLAAIAPFIIMTGMHYNLFPLVFATFAALGYEMLWFPAMLCSNAAQAAAAFAVAAKTDKAGIRSVGISTGITAVCGITEPAMYGVNLRYKIPMIGVVAGGLAGGIFAAIGGVKAYGFVASIIGIAGYFGDSNSTLFSIISVAVSLIVSFVVTFILFKKDTEEVK